MSKTPTEATTEILCAALQHPSSATSLHLSGDPKERAQQISEAFTIIYNTIKETTHSTPKV